jgi:Gas vesicle synthesis protein GvpL/GvpF
VEAKGVRAEPGATHGDTLWYVVGVIRPAPGALDGVPALLPDRPLETVPGEGLEAVASTVPADLLDDRAVEDVDRVGQLARAHDRVLRVLSERTAVAPARLGSLYASREAVAAMLASRAAPLRTTLDQLTGRCEWGVKVYGAPAEAEDPGEAAAAGGGAAGGPGQPGTAYLRRRRAEREARMASRDAAAELAVELHRAMGARAHAAVTRPPQHPKLSGVRAPMLLNAAYLVDVAHQEAFAAAVRDLAERHRAAGVRVQLTGPWPPYSFAGPGAP